MNFSAEQLKPLSTLLNWAHIDEDWAPGDFHYPNLENYSKLIAYKLQSVISLSPSYHLFPGLHMKLRRLPRSTAS